MCRLVRDWNWRQEIDAREGTKITEKERIVVWEIDVGGNPTNPVHVYAGIVPVHKNHVDAEATFIPKNRVDIGTVRVHAGMLTGVWIP